MSLPDLRLRQAVLEKIAELVLIEDALKKVGGEHKVGGCGARAQ